MVVMDAMTGRRSWAAIADSLATRPGVFPLHAGNSRCLGDALWQMRDISGNLVQHPMDPWLRCWRIRVVADQRKLLCLGGCLVPLERRREIVTVTGILGWNLLAILECRGTQLHGDL